MNLTLPIYYDIFYKTKPAKRILVGMNWYRNAHYIMQNKVKNHYHVLIKEQLTDAKFKKPLLTYVLYYKNASCDMMNIISCCDKFLMDALQNNGVIENDNVKYYRSCLACVAEQDKKNPRIEVCVKEGGEGYPQWM